MWVKIIDTNSIPATEITLPESYLFSCDYRRGVDGKIIVSIQKIVSVRDQEESLEKKVLPFWNMRGMEIRLYSGDLMLKKLRGYPSSYLMSDQSGTLIERAEFYVEEDTPLIAPPMPDAPTDLTVASLGDVNSVVWTASASAGVVGYNLYLDGLKRNTGLIVGTTIDVDGIGEGSHDYWITAVNSYGDESPNSEVVSY